MTVRINKPAFNIREKLTELSGRGKNHRAFVLLGVSSGKSNQSVAAANNYTISYDEVLQGDASLWNTTEPGGFAYYFKCPRDGHYKIDADYQLNQVPNNGSWAYNAALEVGTETSFGSRYWGTYVGNPQAGGNNGYDKAGVHCTIFATAGQCLRIRHICNAAMLIEYASPDSRFRLSIIEL